MLSLRETYTDVDLRRQAECWTDIWRNYSTVDNALETLGEVGDAPAHELGGQLERLRAGRVQESAARLIGSLPARYVLDTYGENVAAWTVGNDPEDRRVEIRLGEFEDEGYNRHFLLKSRVMARENAYWANETSGDRTVVPTGGEVLAHNAVMEAIAGPTLQRLNVPELVRRSPAGDIELSERRCRDYGFVALDADSPDFLRNGSVLDWDCRRAAENSGVKYPMYLDTPVGFALTYKGKPQAIAGLAAGAENEVELWQMQRVLGEVWSKETDERGYHRLEGTRQPRGLMPIDWQKLFVLATGEIARATGMSLVGIREAGKIGGYNCHITTNQAELTYNAPARRLGFTQGGDKDWHMPLAQAAAL